MKTQIGKLWQNHSRVIVLVVLGAILAAVSTGAPSSSTCSFLAAATSSLLPSARAEEDLVSSSAPAWSLPDLNGKSVKSSEFAGKVVILDFWATWCPPCRAEIPGFIDLQKKYGSQGLVVIGVSLDQEKPDAIEAFTKRLGMNYLVVLGDEKVTQVFGNIEGLPTTFLIDRTGKIVFRHLGLGSETSFEEKLKPLL